MDPNLHSSLSDSADTKTTFRRPSNDAANRKYRRRSPVSGPSSSDGSPKHGRSRSPIYSREDHAEVSEPHQRRKDDERELDRDSGRSQYGRRDDLYRHSDRHSSRSSHSHIKRDEYNRHDKNVDDEDRNYQRSFSHSGRESRGGHHFDHTRQDSEHNRSRDYLDRYPRDKYDGSEHRGKYKVKEASSLEQQKYKDKNPSFDRAGSGRRHANSKSEDTEKDWHAQGRDGRDEKRDYHKSSCDRRSDRIHSRDESRGHQYDSTSRRDDSRHQLKEAYKSDQELDCQKLAKDEKRKYDDWETKKEKDQYNKVPGERYEDKIAFIRENQNSPAKKPKSSSSNKFTNNRNDADDKQSSSSNPAQETGGKLLVGQSHSNDPVVANNLDAAMKAAELVNRNLVGVGYMTADQKKKLLWGSKKSTTAEESGHRWDNVLLGDRERQEKFNKLMSLRLPWYLWPIVGCEGRCEDGQTRQSRAKWPPPGREAEGTPTGFREAIYCWTSSKRWTHCWIRSLSINFQSFCPLTRMFSAMSLYSCARFWILMILYLRHVMGKCVLALIILRFGHKKVVNRYFACQDCLLEFDWHAWALKSVGLLVTCPWALFGDITVTS